MRLYVSITRLHLNVYVGSSASQLDLYASYVANIQLGSTIVV